MFRFIFKICFFSFVVLTKKCFYNSFQIKDIEEKEIENSDTSFLENKLIALEDLKCLYLEMCFLYPKEAENEITEYFQRVSQKLIFLLI